MLADKQEEKEGIHTSQKLGIGDHLFDSLQGFSDHPKLGAKVCLLIAETFMPKFRQLLEYLQ